MNLRAMTSNRIMIDVWSLFSHVAIKPTTDNNAIKKIPNTIHDLTAYNFSKREIRPYMKMFKTLWPLFMNRNCLKATHLLRGGSLPFTTKSPGILAITWLTSKGWKAESLLESLRSFKPGNRRMEIKCPNYLAFASRKYAPD